MADPTVDQTFSLFSSLRHDPILPSIRQNTSLSALHAPSASDPTSPFYMLPYHRDRMLNASRHFDWPAAVEALEGEAGLLALDAALRKKVVDCGAGAKCLRIRTLLSRGGDVEVEMGEVPAVDGLALFPGRIPRPGEGDAPDGKFCLCFSCVWMATWLFVVWRSQRTADCPT